MVTIQQFYFHCSVILVPMCDCTDLWNVDKRGGTLFSWNIRALCYWFFLKKCLWGLPRPVFSPAEVSRVKGPAGQEEDCYEGSWLPNGFWSLVPIPLWSLEVSHYQMPFQLLEFFSDHKRWLCQCLVFHYFNFIKSKSLGLPSCLPGLSSPNWRGSEIQGLGSMERGRSGLPSHSYL